MSYGKTKDKTFSVGSATRMINSFGCYTTAQKQEQAHDRAEKAKKKAEGQVALANFRATEAVQKHFKADIERYNALKAKRDSGKRFTVQDKQDLARLSVVMDKMNKSISLQAQRNLAVIKNKAHGEAY